MPKQIISYNQLLASIGVIGILFPMVLIITGNILGDCDLVQESLSAYYFTDARDFFVGLLFIMGTLFLSYKGFERSDEILSKISGISAIGVALCPTNMGKGTGPCDNPSAYDLPILHYFFAAIFFLSLIVFSLFIFTKTNPNKPITKERIKRNRLFKTCGWIMIFSLVLMAYNKFFSKSISKFLGLDDVFTFLMEWIFLMAFGVSWIVKSKYFFKIK